MQFGVVSATPPGRTALAGGISLWRSCGRQPNVQVSNRSSGPDRGTVAGCDKPSPPVSEARPVRTVTVHHGAEGEIVSLTGQVRAKDEVSLAFRLDGRMIERPVHVGDGSTRARLSPGSTPKSSIIAALGGSQPRVVEALLTQARLTFSRQQELLEGWLDHPRQFRRGPAEAPDRPGPVDSAQAQLRTARESRATRFCLPMPPPRSLRSAPSRAKWSTPGRWLCSSRARAGATPCSTSPSNSFGSGPRDPEVEIAFSNDPQVKATGRVREIAPQADAATRTFQVKVGIADPPEAMRLGSTVTGRSGCRRRPASSSRERTYRDGRAPAVWVVDRRATLCPCAMWRSCATIRPPS